MENASEALFMAFAVLVFVVALSIGISSFSLARQTTQAIVDRTDRDFDYTYIDFDSEKNKNRIVGIETVIPALYRAYKENYIVRFIDKSGNEIPIYKKKNLKKNFIDNFEEVYKINLEQESIANQKKATLFIDKVLYGGFTDNDDFNKNFKDLQDKGFYDKIKEMKFKEELGIYYIEDEKKENDSSINNPDDSSDTLVSDVNKTEKRVITYIEQ